MTNNMHVRESVCVLAYITAQGSISFGLFDLRQVLGERVLMFGLLIACCVILLKEK